MDSVALLLERARQVGFAIEVAGDQLRVTGCEGFESMALAMLSRKAEIMAHLASLDTVDVDGSTENRRNSALLSTSTPETRRYVPCPSCRPASPEHSDYCLRCDGLGVVRADSDHMAARSGPRGDMRPGSSRSRDSGGRGPVATDTASDEWARRAAALLSGVADPDLRADLRELFEHRAAVCEFDGGLSRADAERIAFGELQRATA